MAMIRGKNFIFKDAVYNFIKKNPDCSSIDIKKKLKIERKLTDNYNEIKMIKTDCTVSKLIKLLKSENKIIISKSGRKNKLRVT
jgi:predicted polyphosphate/ATP-dependent NAD kinase